VRVNGTVVREAGVQVEPDRDRIEVHGRPIPGPSAMRYLMVHKPIGVITTLDDPEGRPTVRSLLPPGPRLFPVGRLDAETSGLLIATNDGELAHHLMHPRYGVRKVYRVRTDRPPDAQQIRRLRGGVEFEPRVVSAPCEVRTRNARLERAEIEIALHEGRYRQVRRMCEAVGLEVKGLHRAAYGPLRIGTLPRGAWRDLTAEEVRRLRAASARPVPRVPTRRPLPRAAQPVPGAATGPVSRTTTTRQVPRSTTTRPASRARATRQVPRSTTTRPASRARATRQVPRSTTTRPVPRSTTTRPASRARATRQVPRSTTTRPASRARATRQAPRSMTTRPVPRPQAMRRVRGMGRGGVAPRPARGRSSPGLARGGPGPRGSSSGFRPQQPRPRRGSAATPLGRRTGRAGPGRPAGPGRGPQLRGGVPWGRGGPARPRLRRGSSAAPLGQRTGRAGPARPAAPGRGRRLRGGVFDGRGRPARQRPPGRPPRH
jgi:23S rRNA pseudouridine2605 synthase